MRCQVTRLSLSNEADIIAAYDNGWCWRSKLDKTVTTEQFNVPLELKHEDIVVKRVAAHEVESSGTKPFREHRIKVPLNREEPVVEKETRVTDGVRVRKTQGVKQENSRERPTRRR